MGKSLFVTACKLIRYVHHCFCVSHSLMSTRNVVQQICCFQCQDCVNDTQHLVGRLWYPAPKTSSTRWFNSFRKVPWLPSYEYAYGESNSSACNPTLGLLSRAPFIFAMFMPFDKQRCLWQSCQTCTCSGLHAADQGVPPSLPDVLYQWQPFKSLLTVVKMCRLFLIPFSKGKRASTIYEAFLHSINISAGKLTAHQGLRSRCFATPSSPHSSWQSCVYEEHLTQLQHVTENPAGEVHLY